MSSPSALPGPPTDPSARRGVAIAMAIAVLSITAVGATIAIAVLKGDATDREAAEAPSVLVIDCRSSLAQVDVPQVAAQVDGVHVLVLGRQDIGFLNADQRQVLGPGTPHAGSGLELGPGRWGVACAPQTLINDPKAWFDVVDPQGFWVDPGVACSPLSCKFDGGELALDSESDLPMSIRNSMETIEPTDSVERAGYPGDSRDGEGHAQSMLRVVRGGSTIAMVTVTRHPNRLLWYAAVCPPLGGGGAPSSSPIAA